MKLIRLILSVIFFWILSYTIYSQLPSLAVAGGPTIGIHFPKIENLNISLKENGFPELPKEHLTLGGQGFFDLPFDAWEGYLRFSGFGNGFTTYRDLKYQDSITRSVKFGMGMGGLGADLVKPISRIFDVYFGLQFSMGSLTLDVYQYDNSHGIWMGSLNDTVNVTRNYKVTFYSGQPQIGVGLLILKFVYLKLNVGYLFSAQGTWQVDDDVEVRGVPSGIKADGLNINLGANFGLFFRD